jgi:hypothetical protein
VELELVGPWETLQNVNDTKNYFVQSGGMVFLMDGEMLNKLVLVFSWHRPTLSIIGKIY